VIALGGEHRIGHAHVIHGETISSGMNSAKKFVETFCATVIAGHNHTAQSYKSSPIQSKKRWVGYSIPTLGTTAPAYARGRANPHLNGFALVRVGPERKRISHHHHQRRVQLRRRRVRRQVITIHGAVALYSLVFVLIGVFAMGALFGPVPQ
jgi:hypothetical protein